MQTKLIIAAVASALAVPAVAAPAASPYALSAVHADFQDELAQIAAMPDEIGAAARAAAALMGPHNAAQESLLLPLLARADAAATGRASTPAVLPDAATLQADLTQLQEGDVALVTALAELYAAADGAQDPAIARLAERMIWHQTADVDVLYPAALLVGATMRGQAMGAGPSGN